MYTVRSSYDTRGGNNSTFQTIRISGLTEGKTVLLGHAGL